MGETPALDVLLAEDEPLAQHALRAHVTALGYAATVVETGQAAWDAFLSGRHRVVISDWLMPEMDGLELCRRIRDRIRQPYTYFILLTVRSGKTHYLTAMDAGVDDFLVKPVDPDELGARLRVAERILSLRQALDQMEGLLQMCSYCKRIRAQSGEWERLEERLKQRAHAEVSHGICPECFVRHVQPQLDELNPQG